MTDRLAASVQYLKGVGPARASALATVGVRSIEDLLLYAPHRYVDRRHCRPIGRLQEGETVTVLATVAAAGVTGGRRRRLVAQLADESGRIEAVWFRGIPYVKGALSRGDLVVASGKVSAWRGRRQMVHPEFEVLASAGENAGPGERPDDGEPMPAEALLGEALHAGGLIPIYPCTAELRAVGLASRGLRRIVRNALNALDATRDLIDPLPEALRRRHGLTGLAESLEGLHFPEESARAEQARRRLAYEEFFYLELVLALRNRQIARRPGRPLKTWGALVRGYLEGLGFTPTGAQQRALAEIFEELARPHPMHRLLQGDVGSGKTMVAICVLLAAVENGLQGALMAPTEILAEQHAALLRRSLEPLGVPVYYLAARLAPAERRRVVQGLAGGEPAVAVGTHALISRDVDFGRLGAVVVDEQHRFGVLQRGALQAKGTDPHVLVMTATPIPRTLAMTLYGDLEVTVLDELPPGREPGETVRLPLERRDRVIERVRGLLAEGRQAYWVFPLVEESEKSDLRAATAAFEQLRTGPLAGHTVGLVHGRMPARERDRVMDAFRRGEIALLVATTVIEVGVDVPNASLMLVEHAERFGLSQLHQLRARVGRGPTRSTCVLLHGEDLTEEAERRLQALCETTDGFRIAEVDLDIRGPGEFFGTRQHGLPELRIAHLVLDRPLLACARTDAFALVRTGRLPAREGPPGPDEAIETPSLSVDWTRRWQQTIQRRMGTRLALGEIA